VRGAVEELGLKLGDEGGEGWEVGCECCCDRRRERVDNIRRYTRLGGKGRGRKGREVRQIHDEVGLRVGRVGSRLVARVLMLDV
jgi:hypothetical protein